MAKCEIQNRKTRIVRLFICNVFLPLLLTLHVILRFVRIPEELRTDKEVKQMILKSCFDLPRKLTWPAKHSVAKSCRDLPNNTWFLSIPRQTSISYKLISARIRYEVVTQFQRWQQNTESNRSCRSFHSFRRSVRLDKNASKQMDWYLRNWYRKSEIRTVRRHTCFSFTLKNVCWETKYLQKTNYF